MPYRYSVAERRLDAATAPPSAPRGGRPARRATWVLALAAGVVAAGGTAGGLIAALGGPRGIDGSPAGRAVQRVALQANVLVQNLGAPAPSGWDEAAFALRSDPVLRVRPHWRLRYPERAWVGRQGQYLPLSGAEADRVLVGQRAALASVFSGALLRAERRELATIVLGERRLGGRPVSPGGARVIRWYSVTVAGASAQAEGLIEQWVQRDRLVRTANGVRIAASVVTERVDARATLVRRGGGWRVVFLAQAPWQEPT